MHCVSGQWNAAEVASLLHSIERRATERCKSGWFAECGPLEALFVGS